MLVHVNAHEGSRQVPGREEKEEFCRKYVQECLPIPRAEAAEQIWEHPAPTVAAPPPPAEATSKAVRRFWGSDGVPATHQLVGRRKHVAEDQRAPSGGV